MGEEDQRMTRWMTILAAGVSALAAAQEPDFSKVEIKATKVAGNIYMLEGAGGNIGVSVGEDGIVIVDDQFAPLAPKIQAALKGITERPVRFVINTHYHFDHVGGNEFFQQQAPVIAQDNVRKRLESGGAAGNFGSFHLEFPPSAREALPIVTFDHQATVHLNGEDIRALHFPSGHTDGDCMVFFTRSNVVHMGDDFVTYGLPAIDLQAGGSVAGMIAALEQVLSTLPADVKIIPGHGPISGPDDVRKFVTMLKETRSAVETAVKAGKTLPQMEQEGVLDRWTSLANQFITTHVYMETLYNELTGEEAPAVPKHD
jgi:cyclase